jgi:hypothetical protein
MTCNDDSQSRTFGQIHSLIPRTFLILLQNLLGFIFYAHDFREFVAGDYSGTIHLSANMAILFQTNFEGKYTTSISLLTTSNSQ